MMVGPGGIGKTTICSFLTSDRLFGGEPIQKDEFSQAALLSASPGIDPQEQLLRQISGNILLTPELSLLANSKDVKRLMASMTRALDAPSSNEGGKYERHTGFGSLTAEIKKFVWISAIVEDNRNFPKFYDNMGSTGYRVLLLRLRKQNLSHAEKVSKLVKIGKGKLYKRKVEKIKKLIFAVSEDINLLYKDGINWWRENDDPATMNKIADLSCLSTKLRGIIQRKNRNIIDAPMIEDEVRTFQYFHGLSQGHAFLNNRNSVDDADLSISMRLACDSAVKWRSDLLRLMLVTGGCITTAQYIEVLKSMKQAPNERVSLATACSRFEDFVSLGIANLGNKPGVTKPFKAIDLADEHRWMLEERHLKLINKDDYMTNRANQLRPSILER